MANWINYAEQRPAPNSVSEWRMPHSSLEGLFVIVVAKMRKRGAGYEDTYSPPFDYWDGYRLHVPNGLQWRAVEEIHDLKTHDVRLVGIEGLSPCACIYCGKTPRLKGYKSYSGGGVAVSPSPNELNDWHLECCAWGKTPSFNDPRKLEETRRAAFARAAEVLAATHQEQPK